MRGCIVPGCKTGYRSAKIKCSAFKVPKNEVMRKKWEIAIPGIEILKDTQCVCEKHFEPSCIIRKWEKRDIGGHIIASVPLKRPRLEETAIPTLFGDAALTLSSHKIKIDSNSSEDEPKDQSLNVHHEVVIDTCDINEENSDEILQSPNENLDDTGFEAIDEFYEERYHSPSKEIAPQNHHEPQIINKQNEGSQTIDMAAIHLEHNYTDKCFLDSELTCASPPRIATKTMKTALPKSWSVKEKYYRGVAHLVLNFTVDRKVNEIEAPMVQRHVMINARSADIRYFVHGVEVRNINSEILPNVLRDLTLLPAILAKFQRTRICQGFGDVDTHFVNDMDAYRDVLNDWRHKQCTLLSENKKCEYCRKFRKILVQRQARARVRLVNGIKLKRIHNTYNEIDQQKLNAMRAKLNVERRIKNRALLQVKKLHEMLRETRKRITEIEGKSFEAKFHELGIDDAQKLTLNEIIAAAKGSPQSRRYSHDWINLCKSMNVKSPEVYEFLRSSNIIPLPCAKTIRKYYSKESIVS